MDKIKQFLKPDWRKFILPILISIVLIPAGLIGGGLVTFLAILPPLSFIVFFLILPFLKIVPIDYFWISYVIIIISYYFISCLIIYIYDRIKSKRKRTDFLMKDIDRKRSEERNRFAYLSLFFGIFSITPPIILIFPEAHLFFRIFLYFSFPIIGLIFGKLSLANIRKKGLGGKKITILGISLSLLSLILFTCLLLLKLTRSGF